LLGNPDTIFDRQTGESIFRWPFRRVPTIDPTNGDPRPRALITAMVAGDRGTVREIVAATTGPDHRTFRTGVIDEAPGVRDRRAAPASGAGRSGRMK
jgi:hypothetical protein